MRVVGVVVARMTKMVDVQFVVDVVEEGRDRKGWVVVGKLFVEASGNLWTGLGFVEVAAQMAAPSPFDVGRRGLKHLAGGSTLCWGWVM